MSKGTLRAGARRLLWCTPEGAELWRGRETTGVEAPIFDRWRPSLLLAEAGRARLRVAGHSVALGPGDVCAIGRGELARIRPLEGALVHRILALPATVPAWPEGTLALDAPELAARLRALPESSLGDLPSWTRQVRRAARGRRRGGAPSAAMRAVADHIEARLDRNEPTDALARVAGLSKYHLARRFARELGAPPHAWRTWCRVSRARALLATRQPLAVAAARCGFTDQSHLHRWFLRLLGITPGRYAAAWRDVHGIDQRTTAAPQPS